MSFHPSKSSNVDHQRFKFPPNHILQTVPFQPVIQQKNPLTKTANSSSILNADLSPFKKNQKRFGGLTANGNPRPKNKNKSFDISRGVASYSKNPKKIYHQQQSSQNSFINDNEESLFYNSRANESQINLLEQDQCFRTYDNISKVEEYGPLYNPISEAKNYNDDLEYNYSKTTQLLDLSSNTSKISTMNFENISGMKPDPPDILFSPDFEMIKRKSFEIQKIRNPYISPAGFLPDYKTVDLGTNPFDISDGHNIKFTENCTSVREFESERKREDEFSQIAPMKTVSNIRKMNFVDSEIFSPQNKIPLSINKEDLVMSSTEDQTLFTKLEGRGREYNYSNLERQGRYEKASLGSPMYCGNSNTQNPHSFEKEKFLYQISQKEEEYEWKKGKKRSKSFAKPGDSIPDSKILEEARSKENYGLEENIDLELTSPKERDLWKMNNVFDNFVLMDGISATSIYLESKREEDLCETEDEKKFDGVNKKIENLKKNQICKDKTTLFTKNKSESNLGNRVGMYKGDLLAYLKEKDKSPLNQYESESTPTYGTDNHMRLPHFQSEGLKLSGSKSNFMKDLKNNLFRNISNIAKTVQSLVRNNSIDNINASRISEHQKNEGSSQIKKLTNILSTNPSMGTLTTNQNNYKSEEKTLDSVSKLDKMLYDIYTPGFNPGARPMDKSNMGRNVFLRKENYSTPKCTAMKPKNDMALESISNKFLKMNSSKENLRTKKTNSSNGCINVGTKMKNNNKSYFH